MSAQWKPGYHGLACQGPQHLSEDFAKDQASPSLVRFSEPREALQAWRASPRVFPSVRNLPSRGHHGCRQGSSQKARRGLRPREDSFLTKRALSPRQSAHGLCAVVGAATHDDASAVIAILVYKAVNKAAPSKRAANIAVSVLRRPSADRKSVV